jgi:glucosylglycerol 3-phosphatase
MTTHPLHEQSYSLDHEAFARTLIEVENLLIIQDLDGVCMGLVKDPLTRVIDPNYVRATQHFDGHFFVLTNGEHGGQRGVNGIVERAIGSRDLVQTEALYLPGLAAGGIQWQTRQGEISHPGVSEAEFAFLAAVPQWIEERLRSYCQIHLTELSLEEQERGIKAAVLDNQVSPTANLNILAELLRDRPELYQQLQREMETLMTDLLAKAEQQGLADAFFVHYAPNLGRDATGRELIRFATEADSGTTDFQFMVRGAIKEAGVLALLNAYYYQRTGDYPLGPDFCVQQAPKAHEELLNLATSHFDPKWMPLIVGVGDTVTSQMVDQEGEWLANRGGSDRNFLQLVQDLGHRCDRGNLVVYIDSSQGEVKNRKPLKLAQVNGQAQVIEGPGDPRDPDDPLTINVAFPGGFQEYTTLFQQAAQQLQRNSSTGQYHSSLARDG